MTTFFWHEEICTYKYRCNLCVGVTVKFIKYFEDYLDKIELKGIVIISTKKLTSWRDVEDIRYAREMNCIDIFQFIFSHSFIIFFSKYFMNIN